MPLLALGKSPGNSPGELKKMVQKVFLHVNRNVARTRFAPIAQHLTMTCLVKNREALQ